MATSAARGGGRVRRRGGRLTDNFHLKKKKKKTKKNAAGEIHSDGPPCEMIRVRDDAAGVARWKCTSVQQMLCSACRAVIVLFSRVATGHDKETKDASDKSAVKKWEIWTIICVRL